MVEVLIIGGPNEPHLEMLQFLLAARKETPLVIVRDDDSENLLATERSVAEVSTELIALITRREESEEIEMVKTRGVNNSNRGLFGINKRAIYKLKDNGKGRRR